MEARLQRRVQRYGWDRAALHYENYWQQQLRPAHDQLLAQAELFPGESVVDVACGTGLVTFRAADRVGPQGCVVGVDVSENMIEHGRRLAELRAISNVSFVRGDAEQLDAVGPTDVALCALGLMYVPDARHAIEEMHRIVRPGGRVVISVWGERRNCGWAEIFPIVDARVESDVCPLFFALGGRGVMDTMMAGVGFDDIEVTRLSTELSYSDDESALGAAFLGGPVALVYARFDEDTRRAVHDEYLASISSYRVGDGYQVPGEFVVVSGRRV